MPRGSTPRKAFTIFKSSQALKGVHPYQMAVEGLMGENSFQIGNIIYLIGRMKFGTRSCTHNMYGLITPMYFVIPLKNQCNCIFNVRVGNRQGCVQVSFFLFNSSSKSVFPVSNQVTSQWNSSQRLTRYKSSQKNLSFKSKIQIFACFTSHLSSS